MKVTRTYSFDSERDREILEHLEKQPNASAYIRNLIALDMGYGGGMVPLDKIVRKLVDEYLQKSAPPPPVRERPKLLAGVADILKMKEEESV